MAGSPLFEMGRGLQAVCRGAGGDGWRHASRKDARTDGCFELAACKTLASLTRRKSLEYGPIWLPRGDRARCARE